MKPRILFFAFILLVLAGSAEVTAQATKSGRTARKPAAAAKPQPAPQAEAPVKDDLKRLILKDGSYQGVIKYQVLGDRVRYYSSERSTWEDIPAYLIDWDATRKYAEQPASSQAPARAREIDAEQAKEKAADEAMSPLVAPGVRLPFTGGVFLLDAYQNKAELSELVQNGAEVNKNTVGNILRAAINPIASAKQTVQLPGPHAKVQSHVGDPFIYIALDQDNLPSDGPNLEKEKKHWRIVRVDEKKGNRVVGNVSIAIYGKVKEKANYIETDVAAVAPPGPWIKIVPVQKLQPGEYALVEMLDEGMNRFVWDFGVNPAAPPNAGAWKAEPAKANAAEADKSPTLNPRRP